MFAPTLPAASTGLMRNVCEPSATYGIVTGVAHGVKSAPSRLQSAPVPSAPYENWKVATDEADCAVGPFATTAVPVGGSLSTVQVVLVGVLLLPAESTERVWKVYAPSVSPVNAIGDVHGAHVPSGSS
jgi:hypothetical protein